MGENYQVVLVKNEPVNLFRKHRGWFPYISAVIVFGTFIVHDWLTESAEHVAQAMQVAQRDYVEQRNLASIAEEISRLRSFSNSGRRKPYRVSSETPLPFPKGEAAEDEVVASLDTIATDMMNDVRLNLDLYKTEKQLYSSSEIPKNLELQNEVFDIPLVLERIQAVSENVDALADWAGGDLYFKTYDADIKKQAAKAHITKPAALKKFAEEMRLRFLAKTAETINSQAEEIEKNVDEMRKRITEVNSASGRKQEVTVDKNLLNNQHIFYHSPVGNLDTKSLASLEEDSEAMMNAFEAQITGMSEKTRESAETSKRIWKSVSFLLYPLGLAIGIVGKIYGGSDGESGNE